MTREAGSRARRGAPSSQEDFYGQTPAPMGRAVPRVAQVVVAVGEIVPETLAEPVEVWRR
jgi:hypothetical protein